MSERPVETSPATADEIKCTTCYQCACRCGIRVHLRDGRVRYIEGNPDHPINRGVLCAKGSAGIMTQYSPARLSTPLRRVGPRGSGEFAPISWDEAIETAVGWLGDIRRTDPRRLAFFTGRDQSQALTGWWASQFGTPNHAAHGGFCSVNMAVAGLYTIGGSFWEFGEPDWERTRLFVMFGCAEDHDSNPIKAGIARLKARGVKFISVNPVRTGYSAVADEWIPIRPGSDGLLILSLIRELLLADKVDLAWLARHANASWLVIDDPGAPDHGLFARDVQGAPLCWDGARSALASAREADATPRLFGAVTLADGRRAVPVFELMARRYMVDTYAPEAVAERTGVPAARIRRLAVELAEAAFDQEITLDIPWTDWAGRRHETTTGRPVSMHAMRGISAHSNGFHTCRALHLLQMILGAIDCPGGFRFKPPFPRPCPPGPKPAGKPGEVAPGRPLPGPPLGMPEGPEDLLVEADGAPVRIDKAFSWDAPIAAHGLMHMVIANAWKGDPYPIDTLFMFMANMSWNSAMNTAGTIEMLTDRDPETGEYRIPHIIYADAFHSEMVSYADLILPDTTYFERFDAISLLDRPISSAEGPADSIRHPVIAPDRDVRTFQDVLLDLGARLGLPGLVDKAGRPRYPGGYADYIVHHERKPGIGTLAGWRGADGEAKGRGAPNSGQLDRYIENGGFWRDVLPESMQFHRHVNRDYLDYAREMGFIAEAAPIVMQLYSEPLQRFRLAAQGHGPVQPPEARRAGIARYFDPLPIWYPPFEEAALNEAEYPLHALTQRPMAMYHSWGSHNAWQRQIHGDNRLYINRATAETLGLGDDDWVWVISHHARVRCQIRPMEGVNPDTVWTWNAIGKRRGAWNLDPDAREGRRGFLLNHLIAELLPEGAADGQTLNADPITGQAAWFDLRVRIEKADPAEADESAPRFPVLDPVPGLAPRPARLGGRR